MSDELKERVLQFNMLKLPGQMPMMHMGTRYLVNDLLAEVDKLRAQLATVWAQLRSEMQECTIRFISCHLGHGRLIGTNWVDTGCTFCDRDAHRQAAHEADLRPQAAVRGEQEMATQLATVTRARDKINAIKHEAVLAFNTDAQETEQWHLQLDAVTRERDAFRAQLDVLNRIALDNLRNYRAEIKGLRCKVATLVAAALMQPDQIARWFEALPRAVQLGERFITLDDMAIVQNALRKHLGL